MMVNREDAIVLKIKDFLKKTYEYEFAQAVWFLENLVDNKIFDQLLKSSDLLKENRSDLYFQAFGKIRFRATVQYKAPATAVSHIEIKSSQGCFQPILWINFTGIGGVQGPLALVYTERIFRNTRDKDNALASFLDIFNHKIISLIYESQKGIPGFVPVSPQKTPIGQLMMALGGVDVTQKANQASTDLSKYLITYRNLFWKKVRTAENLKQILASFFRAKVTIEEFQGFYIMFRKQDTSRIGEKEGCFYTLGRDVFLGDCLWKQDRKIKIVFHEVGANQYETFNPYKKGINLQHLIRICNSYISKMIMFDFFISIQALDKKVVVLGSEHYLGFDTWLRATKPTQDTFHFVRYQEMVA